MLMNFQIKKIIDNSKFSYEQIENLYFYPSKGGIYNLKTIFS